MKKIYFLLSTVLISAASFGQSVTITKVVDGGLASDGCAGTSGTSSPKAIELYVDGTVNFAGYEFLLEANGGTINYQTTDLSGFGEVTNQFVYIVSLGEDTFDEIVPGATRITTNNGSFNGDDYIAITNGTDVLDEFGVLGVDGTDEAWEYLDSYASRNMGVSANPSFTIGEWSFGTVDEFDGTDCATLTATVAFGSYTLSTNNFSRTAFNVYPNPATGGFVNITSTNNEAVSVNVFDILGKEVLAQTVNDNTLNVSSLNAGVYIMKISQNGNATTKKLVIK